MVNCSDYLLQYAYYDYLQNDTDNPRYWPCPPGSVGRFIYLYFEDPDSDTWLYEVFAHTVQPPFSEYTIKTSIVYLSK